MCVAVLEVVYRNSTERDGLVLVEKEEDIDGRVNHYMKLGTVKKIVIFRPTEVVERKEVFDRRPYFQVSAEVKEGHQMISKILEDTNTTREFLCDWLEAQMEGPLDAGDIYLRDDLAKDYLKEFGPVKVDDHTEE